MSRISKRLRPSPAAAIAVVALVFAVSGVAVALPGKNTVATKDIKKNAVTAAKIKDGAVTTGKLGNDAVTGAKVDEATLGKVPSAGTADTATKATTATTAETAVKATEATKATTATNSAELEGRTLAQVRPIAVGVKNETDKGLDDAAFESVMGVNIAVPTGGANVVINAAFELDNGNGAQAGAACRLKFNSSVTSSTVNVTIPAGNNVPMSLTAIDTNVSAGTKQALLECQGSIADNGVDFIEGDMTVQALPIGA